MKFVLCLVTIMFFQMTAEAQILTPSQSHAISNYHAMNGRYIAAYKAMNSLNHFAFSVDLDCNNGSYADWRISQYDKPYMTCVNKKYKKLMSNFAGNYKPKQTELFRQNSELEEELKMQALEAVGFQISKDEYGRRYLDLKKEDVCADRIEEAAELLLNLLEE